MEGQTLKNILYFSTSKTKRSFSKITNLEHLQVIPTRSDKPYLTEDGSPTQVSTRLALLLEYGAKTVLMMPVMLYLITVARV